MQRTASRLLASFGALLVLAAPTVCQETTTDDELKPALTTAAPAQLDLLLKKQAAALASGDGLELMRALNEMTSFDNVELAEPAYDGLTYRATKVDKDAAEAEGEELGTTSIKEVEALLVERVSAVQAAAARLLANFPSDKKAGAALLKAFNDKSVRKDRPKAHAAVIESLGKIGNRKIEGDVYKLFKSFDHEDVGRACVRYFGTIKTKDYSIVRTLCERLAAPEPGSVDSPSNPPESYWASEWKNWSAIRRDVSWALQEITGQVWRPTEGEHPGDSRLALEYVKEHKKELGLE
jgi:hypothetical protein